MADTKGNGLPAPLNDLVGKKLFTVAGLHAAGFGALCFVLPFIPGMLILGGSAESCNNSCAFYIRLFALAEIINGISFLLVANNDKKYAQFVVTGFFGKVAQIVGILLGFLVFGVVGIIGFVLGAVPQGLFAFLFFKDLQASGSFDGALADVKQAVTQAVDEAKKIAEAAQKKAQ